VVLWRRKIRGNVNGLLEDIGDSRELEKKNGRLMAKGGMCCIVCDFNGKMVEWLDVLVKYLFY